MKTVLLLIAAAAMAATAAFAATPIASGTVSASEFSTIGGPLPSDWEDAVLGYQIDFHEDFDGGIYRYNYSLRGGPQGINLFQAVACSSPVWTENSPEADRNYESTGYGFGPIGEANALRIDLSGSGDLKHLAFWSPDAPNAGLVFFSSSDGPTIRAAAPTPACAVPEPSAALLGLFGGLLAFRRRRHSRA